MSFGTRDEMDCLNKVNLCRETPLIVAVRYEVNNAIQLLTEFKVDPDRRDDVWNTALHYAVNNQDINAIERLLQMGANISFMKGNGYACIHIAAHNGNVAVMHCLINCCPEIDVNQRDHKGDTPLIIATKSRNFKTVKKLIWGKVNIDFILDDNGDTPLHLAAMNGDARLVSFLACIAQLTSRNNKGRKVLALAARLGYGVIFKILLDKGADIHTTDNNLLTIMYQACIAEETEFLKYILTTPLFTAPSFVPDNDRGESALHYA
jgi:ankyrin repeat protein